MYRLPARLCCLLLLIVASPRLFAADEPLRTAADRPVDILHIRLDLDVSIESKTVSGTATIDFQPNRTVSSVSLDAVGFDVKSVARVRDGKESPLEFANSGETLLINYPEPLNRQQRERVAISYRVDNPDTGLHFFGPTKDEPETPLMVWSQGEPRSNRYWFPCVDHPDERQTTEIIARVPVGFRVLSNGSLAEKKTLDDGNRIQFHWKQSKSHVAYLVTLVAGKFAVVEEEWNGRPVTYYVPPDREADIRRTFGRTREMLDYFSGRFGDYPWDKYAQVIVEQFTSGGMENTSATTLNEVFLHDKRAMLDSSPDGVIAHELGHQWWGDLVTCRDWAHLWLNEGFATYCEVLWTEHKLGPEERDYLLWQKSRAARSGSPLKRPVVDRFYPTPRSMFDARSYPKGGWVLHMLRSRLGDDEFFRGLQRYGTVFAYQTAETSDLRKIFEQLYGVSLERFFYDWTERKGNPKLAVKSAYDPDLHHVRIEVRQTQEEEPFHFDLEFELIFPDGKSIKDRLKITKREQTLSVPVEQRPTTLRVDPRFTLLAEIDEDKPRDWWQQQVTALTVAERIRAVEHFTAPGDDRRPEVLAKMLAEDPFYGVRVEAAKALGKIVSKTSEDALLAGLDQPHPKVRRACAESLAKFTGNDRVKTALRKKNTQGDPSYFVTAAVLQSLTAVDKEPEVDRLIAALRTDSHRDVIRAAALRGLSKSKDPKAFETLVEWTNRGHSRSARTAAIAALADALVKNKPSPAQKSLAHAALERHLADSGPRVRRSAVEAVARLAQPPDSLKTALAGIVEQEANDSVRTAAERALKRIDTASKPPEDNKALRTELDQLKQKYAELLKRLNQLEQK